MMPERIALIAAGISIVVKEGMFRYAKKSAQTIHSGALMADAWHHRSDALSVIGSFVGIFGARLGYPVLDSLACFVICIFIVKAAVQIFMDAINKMIDRACDEDVTQKIKEIVLAHQDVKRIDKLQSRLFGDKVYIDIEIGLDGNISLLQSHTIAHVVHDAVEKEIENVKHCMIHVNPDLSETEQEL